MLNTGPLTVGAIWGSCWNLRTWDLTGGVGHCGADLKVSLSSTLLPVSLIKQPHVGPATVSSPCDELYTSSNCETKQPSPVQIAIPGILSCNEK